MSKKNINDEDRCFTEHPDVDALVKSAVKLSSEDKRDQFAGRVLPLKTKEALSSYGWSDTMRKKLGLTVPVFIYHQDPHAAAKYSRVGVGKICVPWEPGLSDGPTCARLAVVDYDTDRDNLEEPARWDAEKWCFVTPKGKPITRDDVESPHFHQVHVWAVVRKILSQFEDAEVLGRTIPWGFAGNRLIIVPHAGVEDNAYYDRHSKSLQLYYFVGADEKKTVYTCLSHDIVAHEMGHAILDGIRPYYNEVSSLETAAFHEFVADLTAILSAFRDNVVRRAVADSTKGDLKSDTIVKHIGEEFGHQTEGRDYLRSAGRLVKLPDARVTRCPYECSQVLTGAMFEILSELAADYILREVEREEKKRKKKGKKSVVEKPRLAFYRAYDRFVRVAVQPLDFCPPVDVQFEDYANAVLLRDQLTNPRDPRDYRKTMRDAFRRRAVACPDEQDEPVFAELRCFNIHRVAASRTEAYHFLHRHRERLFIPPHQDFHVVEPYTSYKERRAERRLPAEIVLQYVWREDVVLTDGKKKRRSRFGEFEGETVSLLCGGTLVYDDRGNLLYKCVKPGMQEMYDDGELMEAALETGKRRRDDLLDFWADCIRDGLVSGVDADAEGLSGVRSPLVAHRREGALAVEATPHLRHWGVRRGGGDE